MGQGEARAAGNGPVPAKARNVSLAHVRGSHRAGLDGRGLVLPSLDGDASGFALARLAHIPPGPADMATYLWDGALARGKITGSTAQASVNRGERP
jgi:hypothetical protein